jgi:hypothetical protein
MKNCIEFKIYMKYKINVDFINQQIWFLNKKTKNNQV